MAGAVAALLTIVLTLVVADLATSTFLPEFLIVPIMFGPLPVGIALVLGTPPAARYAFGCGVLIGWPLGLIVSSGLCLGGALTPFRLAG